MVGEGGDHDSPVGEQIWNGGRLCKWGARAGVGAGGSECAGSRIIESSVGTAGHQDLSIIEQGGRAMKSGHAACRREGSGGRIIKLGAKGTDDQDPAVRGKGGHVPVRDSSHVACNSEGPSGKSIKLRTVNG